MSQAGSKVILDIVANHVGQLFYYDINRNGQPDIVFYGGGGAPSGSQVDSAGNQGSELRRVSEWDPEFDYRGVQVLPPWAKTGRPQSCGSRMPRIIAPRPTR